MQPSKYLNIVSLVIIATWFMASIIVDSRSLAIGSFAAILLFLYSQNGKLTNTIKYYHLTIIFISMLVMVALFYKLDSSKGRLLIYKISIPMWRDAGLNGLGVGGFKEQYMHYQSQYFANSDSVPDKEILLSDNTYYLFNDYLQIVLELGIIGVLSVIIIWCLVIRSCISYLKFRKSRLQKLFILLLMPVIVGAIFNHFFERIWVQLLFCITFPLIIYDEVVVIRNTKIRCYIIYVIFFSVFFLVNSSQILYFKSFQKIDEAQQLANCGYTRESLKILESINNSAKNSIEYKLIYASLLYNVEEYNSAAIYLDDILKKYPSSDTYIKLGICRKKQHYYSDAEECFEIACHMTPNRFAPRGELFALYLQQNKTLLARQEAIKIVNLPVKIQSNKVREIKSKARNYLTINQISKK